ncbi:MAG: ABC transporter permease [Acidobacteria bacterium]|nr:ABC transporter permease [Acidobacteriota bacterium]
MGRGFTREDERSGSLVALLSDALWRERFGRDPAVVGRPVTIQGASRIVIGILPPDLVLPVSLVSSVPADVVLPGTFDRAAARHQRGGHYLTGVARLEPGARSRPRPLRWTRSSVGSHGSIRISTTRDTSASRSSHCARACSGTAVPWSRCLPAPSRSCCC